ncbi:ABC transporter ATP-binding protein/permease [Phytoactinopolyspora mesophila]|uniref:ATP-binding cassette domain-containing protein n=1 Tax=Phytoactinopolyspora mesophila TaxID=2650750 RepID=A0A7K3M1H9_9ACTN|nr:ABC transporter ATP-binding protein [Phytoactinopolyspora mesophila]NDL57100.1 ATP-binding cassette domain-containing protein [Phytoactinopolyspora mesophila]
MRAIINKRRTGGASAEAAAAAGSYHGAAEQEVADQQRSKKSGSLGTSGAASSEDERTKRPGVMPVGARLLRLSAGARRWMALGVLVSLTITATYVAQGVLIASALVRIFDGAEWQEIVPLLLGTLLLLAVRTVLLWAGELVAVSTGVAIKARLRRRLYEQLFVLGPGYTTGVRTGTVQATVVDGVEKLETYFSKFLVQLIAAVVGSAAILAGMAVVDPMIGAVLAGAAVAISATPLIARRLQAERSAWFWDSWRQLGGEYLDALQGMTTLKVFDASGRRGRQLSERSWDFYRASIRFVSVANLRTGAMGLLSAGGVALAVGLGAVRLSTGALTAFQLLLVLLLAREAFRPLEDLQKAYHSAYPAISAARGVFRLLESEPVVTDPAENGVSAGSGAITFDDVTFAYRPSKPAVLTNVSLRIDAGETVALVGRSGAGKSTVVALLLRFFDPQTGRICLGDADLSTLPLADLRQRIALVSQSTYLFHGTVRANLALGAPHVSDEQIDDAARSAGAYEFISRLPHGYETLVGERGLTLSGGERQRIAIARALLKDAPILVLDEATSSIDAANEAEIQQALDRLSAGRTTLVIAHRLSSVRAADRIVLLERGRLAATGTHQELLESSAAYARLVAAQGTDDPSDDDAHFGDDAPSRRNDESEGIAR